MKLYIGRGRAELQCPDFEKAPGHRHAQFVWQDGSEHVEHHSAELLCPCGLALVHVGGVDPWAHEHVEVDGTPHDPKAR